MSTVVGVRVYGLFPAVSLVCGVYAIIHYEKELGFFLLTVAAVFAPVSLWHKGGK